VYTKYVFFAGNSTRLENELVSMQDQGQTAELPTIYAMVMTHGHAKKAKG